MPKAIDLRAYRHSMYIRDLAHILEVRLRKSPKRNAAASAAAVFSAKRSHLLPSGLYRRLRNLTGILPFGSRARTNRNLIILPAIRPFGDSAPKKQTARSCCDYRRWGLAPRPEDSFSFLSHYNSSSVRFQ